MQTHDPMWDLQGLIDQPVSPDPVFAAAVRQQLLASFSPAIDTSDDERLLAHLEQAGLVRGSPRHRDRSLSRIVTMVVELVLVAAIGFFVLGSFLCGISSNIHVLVACRIVQGFGGAMMVPVGRLTMVRTFAKYELVRAMSFVAIPGLVGPMLGPVAGGLIIKYFHWSVIFFLNVPIGLLGLLMVYRYLPDYLLGFDITPRNLNLGR